MKFLFIDETEKFNHFGIALICIDSSKYSNISKSVLNALSKHKWDLKEEFKSTCIFSSTEGDKSIDIPTRMQIAQEIIKSNISKKNSAFNCYFGYVEGKKSAKNYELILKKLCQKIPKPQNCKNSKNVIAVYYDEMGFAKKEKDIQDIYKEVSKELSARNYLIVETPVPISSSNLTSGILLSDHIAFIALWKSLNSKERNKEEATIKQQKNDYINQLVDEIKNIKIIKC